MCIESICTRSVVPIDLIPSPTPPPKKKYRYGVKLLETVAQGLLTKGQLVDCYRRNHSISVILPNLQCTFYKNNLIASLKLVIVVY